MSGAVTIIHDPLTSLQGNTIALIKERLPMLKSCEPHAGRFSAEDIANIRTIAPAVHVGQPAVRGVVTYGEGFVQIQVKTVIAILTKDAVFEATDISPRRKYSKDEAATALLASLLTYLPGADFGLGTGPCEDLAADNLSSLSVSKDGVAMWGLHWTNILTLRDPQDGEISLAQLLYSWTPDIGVPHEADYAPIGAAS